MKKIFIGIAVAAASFGAFSASQSSGSALSDLCIENVDLLAEAEDGWACKGGIQEWVPVPSNYTPPEVSRDEQKNRRVDAGLYYQPHEDCTIVHKGYDCMCIAREYLSVDKRCE